MSHLHFLPVKISLNYFTFSKYTSVSDQNTVFVKLCEYWLTLWGENAGASLVRRSQCEVKSSRKKRTTWKMYDRNMRLLWNSKNKKDIQLQGEKLGVPLFEEGQQKSSWLVQTTACMSDVKMQNSFSEE